MKNYGMKAISFLAMALMLISCKSDPVKMYEKIPKIDAHVHIRTGDPSVLEFAKSQGFKFLTINTRSSSQEYIDEQMVFAKKQALAYPDGISYITTFSMENFEEPGWAENVIERLQKDFDEGAAGVKVWKDIGMTFRDSTGSFVFIDDPLFDPILDFIASKGKPMIAHIGEPKNCWLPVESMTVNNDKNYFRSHPQYHMYLHPDYPSYERLVESRDNVLAAHPDLNLVGAHLGSLEWDVNELADRLDRYPNFAVDLAARVCHLQVQEREKVIDFLNKYQDRILYATDIIFSENDDFEEKLAGLEEEWKSDWIYFASGDSLVSPNVDAPFKGLELDKEVLRKIFYTNALHWYPDIFK